MKPCGSSPLGIALSCLKSLKTTAANRVKGRF
jgi:hypothetical protein